jgi:hypothetical protein
MHSGHKLGDMDHLAILLVYVADVIHILDERPIVVLDIL